MRLGGAHAFFVDDSVGFLQNVNAAGGLKTVLQTMGTRAVGEAEGIQ